MVHRDGGLYAAWEHTHSIRLDPGRDIIPATTPILTHVSKDGKLSWERF